MTTEAEDVAKKEAEAQAKLLNDAENLSDLEGIERLGTEVKTEVVNPGDGETGNLENVADDVEAKAKAEADAKAKADADAKAKADADAKTKADEDAKVKADADAKAKADADAKARDGVKQPDGVLLKDGKTVVPYETLAATRRREDEERRAKEDAQRDATEARRQADEARAELDRIQKGGAKVPGAKADLEALREKVSALTDVPEVKDAFDALIGRVNSMSEKIDDLQGAREDDDKRAAEQRADRVQEQIDRNPVLRYWQNEKPDLFNEAAAHDKAMRTSESPAVQALTMEDRFAKAVAMVETIHGKTELPEKYRDMQKEVAEKASADKAAADAKVKADAEAALKSKDVKSGSEVKTQDKPLTLSDLPGGTPPKDGAKALDEMTTGDVDAAVNRLLDQGKSVEEILSTYR